MILILSMLPMIYMRLYQRGYKTAKSRFGMELNYMNIHSSLSFTVGETPTCFFKSCLKKTPKLNLYKFTLFNNCITCA
jgi:hypothetical protein